MTVTEWIAIMVIVAAFELLYLALELLYLAGRSLWRAFQRELDADTLRHIQAETAHYDFLYGGSAGSVGVETPPPALGCPSPLHPGAGLELQAGDSLDRDSSDGSRPASKCASQLRPDAGVQPRTAALSTLPSCGEAAPFRGSGGSGHSSRPESVYTDSAPVGVAPHPCGEGVGAASPRLVAPTRGAA